MIFAKNRQKMIQKSSQRYFSQQNVKLPQFIGHYLCSIPRIFIRLMFSSFRKFKAHKFYIPPSVVVGEKKILKT